MLLSKKDIQSLLKKKILDRWSISFSLMGEIGVLFIAFTNFKRLCFV